MALYGKLYKLRKQKQLSSKELGELIGIEEGKLIKWELGHDKPNLDELLKLSEFFGVSTDYLLKNDKSEEVEAVVEKELSPEDEARNKNIRLASIGSLSFLLGMIGMLGSFGVIAVNYLTGKAGAENFVVTEQIKVYFITGILCLIIALMGIIASIVFKTKEK